MSYSTKPSQQPMGIATAGATPDTANGEPEDRTGWSLPDVRFRGFVGRFRCEMRWMTLEPKEIGAPAAQRARKA